MRKKIVIIGGGIVGASTAYALSKGDADVILIDRADSGQATDAAAGIICPWLSQRRNKAWYQLVTSGAKMYHELMKELEADGETDTGYKSVGALGLHREEKTQHLMYERAIKRREKAPEIGEIRLLNEAETMDMYPLLADGYQSVYVSGAARVNGRKLRDAMLRGAEKHGAEIIKGNAELLIDGNKIIGAEVENQKIRSDVVIMTAGAWMDQLIKPLDVQFDIQPQKAQIIHLKYEEMDTSNLPVILPPGDHYVLSFDDHRFVIGATHEDNLGFDTRVTAVGVQEVLNKALDVAPGLKGATLLETRVGFRPMSPESLPIIGSVPGYEGGIFANGLGATGLTAGPFLGRELAKMAMDQETALDLTDYQLQI
jgi:D-amino-acid dehydrogenase